MHAYCIEFVGLAGVGKTTVATHLCTLSGGRRAQRLGLRQLLLQAVHTPQVLWAAVQVIVRCGGVRQVPTRAGINWLAVSLTAQWAKRQPERYLVFDQLLLQAARRLAKEGRKPLARLASEAGALMPLPNLIVALQSPLGVIEARVNQRASGHAYWQPTARQKLNYWRRWLDTRRALRVLGQQQQPAPAILVLDARLAPEENAQRIMDFLDQQPPAEHRVV